MTGVGGRCDKQPRNSVYASLGSPACLQVSPRSLCAFVSVFWSTWQAHGPPRAVAHSLLRLRVDHSKITIEFLTDGGTEGREAANRSLPGAALEDEWGEICMDLGHFSLPLPFSHSL